MHGKLYHFNERGILVIAYCGPWYAAADTARAWNAENAGDAARVVTLIGNAGTPAHCTLFLSPTSGETEPHGAGEETPLFAMAE